MKLTARRVAALVKTGVLEAMNRGQEFSQLELDALHTDGRYREDLLRDFVEMFHTGYSRLMRMHATNYRNGIGHMLYYWMHNQKVSM